MSAPGVVHLPFTRFLKCSTRGRCTHRSIRQEVHPCQLHRVQLGNRCSYEWQEWQSVIKLYSESSPD